MSRKFITNDSTFEYNTASDRTNSPPGNLVAGSRNCLIDRNRKVRSRNGFSRLGTANTALTPVRQTLTWHNSTGGELPIRVYDDELEVYLGTVDGTALNAWYRVASGWATTPIPRFAPWWNDTEKIDQLTFVWGDNNFYRWNGAVAIVSSITATTITKTGTDTWAQNRFYSSGNKTLVNVRTGTEYTYTGGEGTTTLTGIADTTGIIAGDVLIQKIVTNSTEPVSSRTNDTMIVFENQLVLGSESDNLVYISQNDDPADFAFSSPRVAGEGAILTLDGISRGFGFLNKILILFAGKSSVFQFFYQSQTVGTTAAEVYQIKKLQTGALQCAQSQEVIIHTGNAIVFLSFEPALRLINSPEDLVGIDPKTLSNPIKPDFDNEDWTTACGIWHKNSIYLSAPTYNHTYILEFVEDADGKLRRFWQPPQILPVRPWFIYGGNLHGGSASTPDTYRLFDPETFSDITWNEDTAEDEKIPIDVRIAYSYRNYGDRANEKNFDEYFVEGEIGASTTDVTLQLNYDFGAHSELVEKTIDGSNEDIVEESLQDVAQGQQTQGGSILGGALTTPENAAKFRAIFEMPRTDFHEVQPVFILSAVDTYFAVHSHGSNVSISRRMNTRIKL